MLLNLPTRLRLTMAWLARLDQATQTSAAETVPPSLNSNSRAIISGLRGIALSVSINKGGNNKNYLNTTDICGKQMIQHLCTNGTV